jgi:hypothetical protein
MTPTPQPRKTPSKPHARPNGAARHGMRSESLHPHRMAPVVMDRDLCEQRGEAFGARCYRRRRQAAARGRVSDLAFDERLRRSIAEKWPGARRPETYWLLVGARRGYHREAQIMARATRKDDAPCE